MIRLFDIGKLGLALLAVFVVACSDTSVSDSAGERSDMGVVATAEKLPPCTAKNDGESYFVKSEKIIRICSDTKWYAVKNEESGKSDSSGCYVSEQSADSLWVTCGSYSFSVPTSGANNGESVVLDSEKIATSLEGVSGFTQKGPFLMGSEVNVIDTLTFNDHRLSQGRYNGLYFSDHPITLKAVSKYHVVTGWTINQDGVETTQQGAELNWMMPACSHLSIEPICKLRGDFDNSNVVDQADIDLMVSAVMRTKTDTTDYSEYDLNDDKKVDAADLVILVSIINKTLK